jgi:hypothetical protein
MTEFHDQAGRVVHGEFQEWRRLHPDGFFLTFPTKRRARLHAALCRHCGNVEWTYEDVGQSLTRERKRCAESQDCLLTWASGEAIEVLRCQDCLSS